MISVDTSVLIGFLRGHETAAVLRLKALAVNDVPFRIPWVCVQELLQGARGESEWNTLARYLTTQRLLPVGGNLEAHVEAGRIYFDCRRQGVTIRSTIDCLIAQAVIAAGDTLLHDDEDFERIAQVRPLSTLRG